MIRNAANISQRKLRDVVRRIKARLKGKRQAPLAIATDLATLKEQSHWPWRQIQRQVGLSTTHRKLLLSLLALPSDMASVIVFGEPTRKSRSSSRLGLKHARSLYLLRDDPDQQRALFDQLRLQGPGANQVLRAVLAKRQGRALKSNADGEDPNLQAALDRLRYKFGTKVSIHRRAHGGEFAFEFYSEEDIIRLYDLFMA